ncbi:hypothetical protein [Desulfobacula toluolica]|uniref:Uncharacterized protein n=1 Tax=Desulfobacula toluolica (strain DSM 7467 / Tol2) TaxID=651182 RepID=K0NLI7_DESTT|nr:hypothetical protein [Desulfobacula toluolica]CCK82431.1 uncharacterized protein TOL2_C42750 [Desulfobacula toluolica Tol2]
MNSKDIVRFSEIMMGLAENYPGTNLTHIGLQLRFEALKEYGIDHISRAATKLIKTRRYHSMPTTADIIEAMDGDPGKISMEYRAEIEAGKVLDHLRGYGKNIFPKFKDPITRHLMTTRWRYNSWAAYVTESELKWWQREFVRAYLAHAVGARAGYCLPGVPELKRLAHGIGQFM